MPETTDVGPIAAAAYDTSRLLRSTLRHLLAVIDYVDPSANGTEGAPDAAENYAARNAAIWHVLGHAAQLGIPCGVAIDPAQPDWPVAYIELPTGQVSWHLPAYPRRWDGHTGNEKRQRIHAFVDGPPAPPADPWAEPEQGEESRCSHGIGPGDAFHAERCADRAEADRDDA